MLLRGAGHAVGPARPRRSDSSRAMATPPAMTRRRRLTGGRRVRAGVVASRGRRDPSRGMKPVIDPRITVITGERHAGPNELIGVLELRADGSCRAAVAERVEVDGRCHIRLAREAWQ